MEGVFGTTVQTLKSVAVGELSEEGLSAVCSRLSRQQEEEIVTLNAKVLQVDVTVGQEGWQALARAVKANPNGVWRMEASKDSLVEARKEDVKDIWEAVRDIFIVWISDPEMWDGSGPDCLMEEKPEGTWEMLEQILDFTKREFMVAARKRWELDSLGSDEYLEEEDNEDEEDEKDGDGKEDEKDEEDETDEEDEENEQNKNGSLDEDKAWPQGEPDN